MDRFHLSKDEWIRLESELAQAERHGTEEFFATYQAQAAGEQHTTPGGLLLQHLLAGGDEEGVALFRATEMIHHELSRHGYAAAYRLGQQHPAAGGDGDGGAEAPG
jgi:hypothetical protein